MTISNTTGKHKGHNRLRNLSKIKKEKLEKKKNDLKFLSFSVNFPKKKNVLNQEHFN